MSVSRLVIGVVFLGLGAVFFRGRRRLSGRVPLFVTVLAWIYTVIGLLWVALAFA